MRMLSSARAGSAHFSKGVIMANNYCDATGVLMLDRVTPVIKALFGAFNLDETYPGNGQAYIARISESNNPVWDDVRGSLAELAAQLGLIVPNQDDEAMIETLLRTMAVYFKADQNEELETLIEHHSFDDTADLEALFLIATCFDDGHHLEAIMFEGCWYCSKPRLFEFGGDGCFLSREICLSTTSSQAIGLGQQLRNAILAANIEEASRLVAQETGNLLSGINDLRFRSTLRQRVAERLIQTSTPGVTV
jgi:hypothetical protein